MAVSVLGPRDIQGQLPPRCVLVDEDSAACVAVVLDDGVLHVFSQGVRVSPQR